MRRRLAVTAALAGLTLPAWPQERPELAGLTRRSSATMRFLGLRIYDIHLWATEPISAQRWQEQDLTLEIAYARSLKGAEIARRSLQEMERQGEIPAEQGRQWLAQMTAAFPDVQDGDRISGRFEPGRGATFFVNGTLRRRIDDPLFAQRFFGIWLSAQTSEPRMREALLK